MKSRPAINVWAHTATGHMVVVLETDPREITTTPLMPDAVPETISKIGLRQIVKGGDTRQLQFLREKFVAEFKLRYRPKRERGTSD